MLATIEITFWIRSEEYEAQNTNMNYSRSWIYVQPQRENLLTV